MTLFTDLSGWLGAFVVLAGYACFSLGWIRAGYRFQLANLIGSAALAFSNTATGSWPSVALNICWCLFSAVAIVRLRGTPRRDRENIPRIPRRPVD